MWGSERWATRFARRSSQGSITAETAVVLPALVAVLAAALWAVTVVEARLRCVDAARAGARAAARGEPLTDVRLIAARLAPEGARVTVERGPETTSVTVSADVRPGWHPSLPAVTVHSTSTAATEPGAEAEKGGDAR